MDPSPKSFPPSENPGSRGRGPLRCAAGIMSTEMMNPSSTSYDLDAHSTTERTSSGFDPLCVSRCLCLLLSWPPKAQVEHQPRSPAAPAPVTRPANAQQPARHARHAARRRSSAAALARDAMSVPPATWNVLIHGMRGVSPGLRGHVSRTSRPPCRPCWSTSRRPAYLHQDWRLP